MSLAVLHWNTTNSRVRPPSTVSSTTRSARSMPACGRPTSTLSIFTASATRSGSWPSVGGTPVSGQRFGSAAGLLFFGGAGEEPPPLQATAPAKVSAAMTASAVRRVLIPSPCPLGQQGHHSSSRVPVLPARPRAGHHVGEVIFRRPAEVLADPVHPSGD